jgi:methylmalonyl-CoA mutase
VDDVIEAFRRSGARAACLCGSDRSYGDQAEEVAAGLRAAGAIEVYTAGKPAGYRGITEYVYAGCDALSVLRGLLRKLGVD